MSNSASPRSSKTRDTADFDGALAAPFLFWYERDDFSSNRHSALASCLTMISEQTLRVCRGKPLPTFPDHALATLSRRRPGRPCDAADAAGRRFDCAGSGARRPLPGARGEAGRDRAAQKCRHQRRRAERIEDILAAKLAASFGSPRNLIVFRSDQYLGLKIR